MNSTASALGLQAPCASIPENFDPRIILPADRHRYCDHARHTISRIATGPIRDRRCKDGFVPMRAADERAFYPTRQSYTQVKRDLVEGGALECDGVFTKGAKALHYRPGPAFRSQPIRTVIITDPALIKRIADDQRRRLRALSPVCQKLFDKLRMLRIDHPAAKASLARDANGYSLHDLAIDMIRDRWFFAVQCEYGRLHTSATNFKSSLRCYLTAQGRHLVSLDFVNFQPTLFAFLAQERCAGRSLPRDARRYKDACLSGRFYEVLAGKELQDQSERRKVKRRVFRVLFGRNDYSKRTPRMAERFMELFPSVYALLLEWKAREQNHRVVSWQLQKSESSFILGRVAPVLLERFPRKFISTVHDCFLVTAGMEADVQAILEAEARKHFGVSLQVETKYLTPPARST